MRCPHCQNTLPDGLQVCFRCGEPLHAVSAPSSKDRGQAEEPQKAPGGRKRALAIAAVVLVFALGAAAGGHFLGLYSLPMLPAASEQASSGETADPGAAAAASSEPSGNAEDTPSPAGRDIIAGAGSAEGILPAVVGGHIELHIEDSSHAVMILKGVEVPRRFSINNPETSDNALEVYWEISFTDEGKNLYTISSAHFVNPEDRTPRMAAHEDIQTNLWKFDAQTGSSSYLESPSAIASIGSDTIAWEVVIPEGEPVNLTELVYAEYSVGLYGQASSQAYMAEGGNAIEISGPLSAWLYPQHG